MRPLSRYSLPLLSFCLLLVALSVWSLRRANALRATALLNRTYAADNELTYSALSTVTAMYGAHEMQSTAQVVRAPGKLSITYISGDHKGLQSGYNDVWGWRRDNAQAPLVAYAQNKIGPDAMAARRFDLMLKNYRAYWLGQDVINGLPAELVEVRPRVTVDGAHGPMKRFWIDTSNGLTVRSDSFNYQRQPIMITRLTQIDMKPQLTDATFASPQELQQAAQRAGWQAEEMGNDCQAAERLTGIHIGQPHYLPPGFEFDGLGVHQCRELGGGATAALSRYTDGLNTLTIFALPLSSVAATAPTHGSCDFGPGTIVMEPKNNVQTIAVADLSPVTLRRVLDSTDVAQVTAK